MKKLILFFTFFSLFVQAQNYTKHKVLAGETLFSISKKYRVSTDDVCKINPDAKNGLKENAILLIPNTQNQFKTTTHKVAAKETLFSIAKQYNISVAEVEKWNKETLKEGLKLGQEIYVSKPSKAEKVALKKEIKTEARVVDVVTEQNVKNVTSIIVHKVVAQETKYGIATKYGISVDELDKLNPGVKGGLNPGDVLTIKTKQEKKLELTSKSTTYEVQPKETVFSLTKKLNVSQDELYNLNPELKNGLKEGMVLNIPAYRKKAADSILVAKNKVDLLKTADFTTPKELVLMLPFNMNKIENDSLKSKAEYLKTNKFLNLTLDYYSGALMAIDSAKTLGLPINVRLYDVESSKYSSNVASIIAKNDFSKVDAVIGPFQSSHVETTAQLLAERNIPVISPLSKEKGLALPNLYYAVPSEEKLKANLFAYFKENNGNVIGILSTKKITSKEYLSVNYPELKHAVFNEKGVLDVTHLKSQLVKDRPNFVILEIEKASTILSITNTLKNLQKEYTIQLVVFEVYEALDFEEIPIKNLTSLKMMYPAVSKEIETPEEVIFVKKFKNANNITPNKIAVKGFDVTFDTILRVCQPEGFVDSIAKYKTEHIENSFDYSNENGANNNNGCYILYYDTDLTIKKAQ